MDDIPKIPEREITPPALYFNRRRFLRGGIAAGSAIATAALYRRLNPTAAIDLVPSAPVQLSTPKLAETELLARGWRVDEPLTPEQQYPQLQQLLRIHHGEGGRRRGGGEVQHGRMEGGR